MVRTPTAATQTYIYRRHTATAQQKTSTARLGRECWGNRAYDVENRGTHVSLSLTGWKALFCFAPPDSVSGLPGNGRGHRDIRDRHAPEHGMEKPTSGDHSELSFIHRPRFRRRHCSFTRDVAIRSDGGLVRVMDDLEVGTRSAGEKGRSVEAMSPPRHHDHNRASLHSLDIRTSRGKKAKQQTKRRAD